MATEEWQNHELYQNIKSVAVIKIVDRDQPNILVALIVPAYCVKKQNKCTYNLSSFFQAVFVNLNEAGTS